MLNIHHAAHNTDKNAFPDMEAHFCIDTTMYVLPAANNCHNFTNGTHVE